MLTGVDERGLEMPIRIKARSNGAIFMKFGRAPTTQHKWIMGSFPVGDFSEIAETM